jgi:hypothetical protein
MASMTFHQRNENFPLLSLSDAKSFQFIPICFKINAIKKGKRELGLSNFAFSLLMRSLQHLMPSMFFFESEMMKKN